MRKRLFVAVVALGPCIAAACSQIAGITPVPIPVDAGIEVGVPEGAVCDVGQVGCVSNAVSTCGANGQWNDDAAMACVDMTCLDASCSGMCAPGQTTCRGGDLQSCSLVGTWLTSTKCATGVCATDGGDNCSGSTTTGTSCMGTGQGISNCGPAGKDSCCLSYEVPGGSFLRGYDGVTTGNHNSKNFPASVSGLRVDKYLVTVGRFRQWVNAFNDSPLPIPQENGAGIHKHLNDGNGLADPSKPGVYESGWNISWNSNIPTSVSAWDDALCTPPEGGPVVGLCSQGLNTWTTKAGKNENLPINYVNWYEAYAFCIWDGGFLPSEAEWNYVAAGGSQQRLYPWSAPPNTMNNTIDCSHADFAGCGSMGQFPVDVGVDSAGDGLWGHADLAGNVWEWALDWETPTSVYPPECSGMPCQCSDCANTGSDNLAERIVRGGAYYEMPSDVIVETRYFYSPQLAQDSTGFRCARVP